MSIIVVMLLNKFQTLRFLFFVLLCLTLISLRIFFLILLLCSICLQKVQIKYLEVILPVDLA